MAASSISRRIELSIISLGSKDYENAFIQLFPALDKTAKSRRPKDGVGSRIKAFISDEEVIITAVATNNIIRDIEINGLDLATAIYKFGRTSIVHEGELDERLTINEKGNISIGEVWNLPSSYILGLIVAVVIAPENSREHLDQDISIRLFGETFRVKDLWGKKKIIQEKICQFFQDDDLFK